MRMLLLVNQSSNDAKDCNDTPSKRIKKIIVFIGNQYYFKGSTFGLWERSAVAEIMGEENLGENAHSFLIAIRLPTCEDINEIHKEFVERGVICVCEPKTYDFGQRAAFYQDHEENIWEFYAICE